MKKGLNLLLALSIVVLLAGCADTQDNKDDWKTTSQVEISDDILQVCYDVMDEKSYEYNKNDYKSVLLGDMIDYVATFDGVDNSSLDEEDILVQFEAMRIVIDSDTNEALGSIPYV